MGLRRATTSRVKDKTGYFISTWNTSNTSTGSSTATQIKLPLISGGTYNFTVEWGDGSNTAITTFNQSGVTHTYATAGVYQLRISGIITGWQFINTGDRLKILSIQQWGPLLIGTTQGSYFYGCANLNIPNVRDILNLSGTTILTNLFRECPSLSNVNRINEWNTSGVTSMNFTFYSGSTFNGDISTWNTSNVTTLDNMIGNNTLFNQDIGTKVVTINGNTYTAWDIKNVTTLNGLLANPTAIPGRFNNGGSDSIRNWNTSKVTLLTTTFQGQPAFNQPINTSAVTVNGTSYIAWDTSNVTGMGFVFNCGSGIVGQFNQPIGNWNTSKVTTIRTMFQGQPAFNQNINTQNVTVSGNTYTAWDTKNVTDMGFVFNAGTGNIGQFNQPIGNWNTSKVTLINSMFQLQPNFNQDIGTKVVTVSGTSYIAWDISKVTTMNNMLYAGSTTGTFNNGGSDTIKNWNTSSATTINTIFGNQVNFNQPINTQSVTVSGNTYSGWTTSKITDFGFAFWVGSGNTGSFNQNIGNWNTSSGTTMDSMFLNQVNFNQSLSGWNVSNVLTFNTGASGFMLNTGLSQPNYDSILIGWSSRLVKPNLVVNFGNANYSSAATASRTILTTTPNNWTLIDGGLI